MKKYILVLFIVLTSSLSQGQDKLIETLRSEMKNEFSVLSKQPIPAYFMSYRVEQTDENYISGKSGSLQKSSTSTGKVLTVQVRVGDYNFDNFHTALTSQLSTQPYSLSNDHNEKNVRTSLWKYTDREYRKAIDQYSMTKSNLNMSADDKSPKEPDYTKSVPYSFYEKPLKVDDKVFDKKAWEDRIQRLSLKFKSHTDIIESSVSLSFKSIRKYYVSTENVNVVENLTYAVLTIDGKSKADDGMELPLYHTFFAYLPKDLPSDAVLEAKIDELIGKLKKLRVAPVVDPFTGPAILSGQASGVFFHEIFGHRIEAQPMKDKNNGQTFKSMLGQPVLPLEFTVCDDPSLRLYHGFELNGSYRHDEEGVKGERVTVVDKGILRNFLTTKVPAGNFSVSNGHARAQAGIYSTSRQSNLIIETSTKYTESELRQMLIAEAKKQNKEYGFYMATVTGGFTNTSVTAPNSFNVTPIEVYKVFVDGRPDELVRGVDLVGTPLSMFSFITAAGGNVGLFTGICTASSGQVPVTAISPSLFVSKIEFQRKGTDNSDKPILPRPY